MKKENILRLVNLFLIILALTTFAFLFLFPCFVCKYSFLGVVSTIRFTGPAGLFGGTILMVTTTGNAITTNKVETLGSNPLGIASLVLIIIATLLLIIRIIAPKLFKNWAMTFLPSISFIIAGILIICAKDTFMHIVLTDAEISFYKTLGASFNVGAGPIATAIVSFIVGIVSLYQSVDSVIKK